MHSGLVHRHMRKRKSASAVRVRKETFWIKVLDKVTLAAGVVGPMMTLPQIYKIYYFHSAAGVSAISWLAFGTLDLVFIFYGLAHKDTPIVSTYILWFIANFTVGIGALIY